MYPPSCSSQAENSVSLALSQYRRSLPDKDVMKWLCQGDWTIILSGHSWRLKLWTQIWLIEMTSFYNKVQWENKFRYVTIATTNFLDAIDSFTYAFPSAEFSANETMSLSQRWLTFIAYLSNFWCKSKENSMVWSSFSCKLYHLVTLSMTINFNEMAFTILPLD